jgi:hypothetical protein
VGEFVGESAQIHRRHALIRQFERFRRRMYVPLKNCHRGMPHQSHYSERIRSGLSQSRPKVCRNECSTKSEGIWAYKIHQEIVRTTDPIRRSLESPQSC